MNLFFDLDGTLCESKQLVEKKMLKQLERLAKKHKIFIVSGGAIDRLMRQCPMDAVFMSQNGNKTFENESILWENEFNNKIAVLEHIATLANAVNINVKADMIEDRGNQVSFSFVGHSAPFDVKRAFDPTREKRASLLSQFPFTHALIGGTTCIDYVPKTKGDNIRRYMELRDIQPHECLYFGDALQPFGNDYTVFGVIPTFPVNCPEDTYNFIKNI